MHHGWWGATVHVPTTRPDTDDPSDFDGGRGDFSDRSASHVQRSDTPIALSDAAPDDPQPVECMFCNVLLTASRPRSEQTGCLPLLLISRRDIHAVPPRDMIGAGPGPSEDRQVVKQYMLAVPMPGLPQQGDAQEELRLWVSSFTRHCHLLTSDAPWNAEVKSELARESCSPA